MKIKNTKINMTILFVYYYSLGFAVFMVTDFRLPLYNEVIGIICIIIFLIRFVFRKILTDTIEENMEMINNDPNYFWNARVKTKKLENRCTYVHKNLVNCNNLIVKNEKYCYWHLPNDKKYSHDFIKKTFNRTIDFKSLFVEHIKKNKDISGYYLKASDLSEVNFKSMIMRNVNLEEANLKNSIWEDTFLNYAKLNKANLSESSFKNIDFLETELFDAKLRNIELESIKNLSKENFEGVCCKVFPTYRILEMFPVQAKDSYKKILAYFIEKNMLEDASWAAYKERQMMRKYLMIKSLRFISSDKPHLHKNEIYEFIYLIINKLNLISKVIWMIIFEISFGYGEKLKRLILTSSFTMGIYALVFYKYKMLDSQNYKNIMYFSICNFLNIGYGDILPKEEFKYFAVSETILGIIFIGLLFVVLVRKVVGRN